MSAQEPITFNRVHLYGAASVLKAALEGLNDPGLGLETYALIHAAHMLIERHTDALDQLEKDLQRAEAQRGHA